MAVLGGLAVIAEAGKGVGGPQGDVVVAIKVDGTWESIYTGTPADTNWKTLTNGSQLDLAIDHQPTYENTGGSDVVITDICVGVEQDTEALVTELNSDEAGQANNLIIPIHTVQGSPRTVVPLEIVQFTTIKTAIESP